MRSDAHVLLAVLLATTGLSQDGRRCADVRGKPNLPRNLTNEVHGADRLKRPAGLSPRSGRSAVEQLAGPRAPHLALAARVAALALV